MCERERCRLTRWGSRDNWLKDLQAKLNWSRDVIGSLEIMSAMISWGRDWMEEFVVHRRLNCSFVSSLASRHWNPWPEMNELKAHRDYELKMMELKLTK